MKSLYSIYIFSKIKHFQPVIAVSSTVDGDNLQINIQPYGSLLLTTPISVLYYGILHAFVCEGCSAFNPTMSPTL